MITRASEWTSGEVASAVGGRLHGDSARKLAGVATDTRDALRDQLFIALIGPRHDAHDFLEQAAKAGASALLVRSGLDAARVSKLAATATVIEVDDTLKALGRLAKAHRKRLGPGLKVVGLTGSNGKTSTKEMLAAVLAEAGRVLKTEGNLNNWIGMPLTLLSAKKSHDYAVLEMGMNALGEIAWMTSLAEPNVGLVTNVGPAHVGELGGIENVGKAKGELFQGLPQKATMIVNLDDVRVVAQAALVTRPRRTFGRHASADVRVASSETRGDAQIVTLDVDGHVVVATLPYPGMHNALNAAGAVAAATAMTTLAPAVIARGLSLSERAHGRMETKTVGPFSLIDDAYNANGASMIAAIETVSSRAKKEKKRFVAVLGEMRELGDYSPEEHARVGHAVSIAGCSVLATFGALAAPIAGAANVKETRHEDSDDAALFAWLRDRLVPGDLVLVKGSRGIRMERFIERLQEAFA